MSNGAPLGISPASLKRMLDIGEPFLLLDVRNADEFARWQIDGLYPPETLNIPYFEFLDDAEACAARVPSDKPIVAVCAKGGSSDWVAREILRPRGYDVTNLEGGMLAWGKYYQRLPVPEAKAPLRIWQISRPARGCLHYVLALVDVERAAIVVDPPRHLEPILELLAEEKLRLTQIIDTHAHADHVSGGAALAKRTGAPYFLHPYDGIHPIDMLPARVPFDWLADGRKFKLGSATLEALHVPGHTLGMTALLLKNSDQTFLFSGDTIFLRSLARPDLGGQANAWAPLHYHSIFDVLLKLPGQTLVLPGHFSQPREGRADGLFAMRLSELQKANSELAPRTESDFTKHMLASLPPFPPQYVDIKRVNAGLLQADDEKLNELEMGRNLCALAGAYDR